MKIKLIAFNKLWNALWSISSGWLILLLLGIFYGLAKLRLLPLELGFSGSAALVLAAYFLCRDMFKAGLSLDGNTHIAETNELPRRKRRQALIGVATAVLVFMTAASVHHAIRESSAARETQKLKEGERDLSPEQLSASAQPDSKVTAIWITFRSNAGFSYLAVHVFRHPSGPYILLSSVDKQHEDFLKVGAQLAQAYDGLIEGDITDRDDDISDVINIPGGFTQKEIAVKLITWFPKTFLDTKIKIVYYQGNELY